jgi:predicted PhzF superfamily epimerase YddE/YHI9
MTPGISFYAADVFTAGLDTRLMRAIAKELNLSETVFVFPPDNSTHTRRLRIFTTGAEAVAALAGYLAATRPAGAGTLR